MAMVASVGKNDKPEMYNYLGGVQNDKRSDKLDAAFKQEKSNFSIVIVVDMWIQQHLSMAQNFPPDLMKYAAATHKLDDMKIVIPKDMIPDDMFLDIGNGLSGEDIKFFSDNYQIFYKLLSGNITDEEFMALGKNHDEIEELRKENTEGQILHGMRAAIGKQMS